MKSRLIVACSLVLLAVAAIVLVQMDSGYEPTAEDREVAEFLATQFGLDTEVVLADLMEKKNGNQSAAGTIAGASSMYAEAVMACYGRYTGWGTYEGKCTTPGQDVCVAYCYSGRYYGEYAAVPCNTDG